MNEFVDNLDYEKILGYVKNYGINVETGINPKENHAAYFAACVAADGAKYDKNDKYYYVKEAQQKLTELYEEGYRCAEQFVF